MSRTIKKTIMKEGSIKSTSLGNLRNSTLKVRKIDDTYYSKEECDICLKCTREKCNGFCNKIKRWRKDHDGRKKLR